MEDLEIKCLPTNFVVISKPSKAIERLTEKRKNAELAIIEKMCVSKRECCQKINDEIEVKSNELKTKLREMKRYIEEDFFEAKKKTNLDNIFHLKAKYFDDFHQRILSIGLRRHNLVEDYHQQLIVIEKQKAAQFQVILKHTYQELMKISYHLPRDIDEIIEKEIEEVNQIILNNHRNYAELTTELQLQIENDSKSFVQDLKKIKENWLGILKGEKSKILLKLKSGHISKTIQKDYRFQQQQDELTANMSELQTKVSSLMLTSDVKEAEKWLETIQKNLASLDKSSQKIVSVYKQAAIVIFNRFFEELESINVSLLELDVDEAIPDQYEMYTPTLQEIQTQYSVDLETIQKYWNDSVEDMKKIISENHTFLITGTTLWEDHFKRLAQIQILLIREIDGMVGTNNSSAETYDTKLNIIIDTLRQESNKEKVGKIWEDIKKLLSATEELYKSQFTAEFAVSKKYRNYVDLETEVLMAEIKRFLAIYPPNPEKDPKIQRKRASQTSEIVDPRDGAMPNQMMFCKFQTDAVSNWQFGVWEAMNHYTENGREELLKEADGWIEGQEARLDKRLETRMLIHRMRLDRIKAYIYDQRLSELCLHNKRFEEHREAIDRHLKVLKDKRESYEDKYREIVDKFNKELQKLESKTVTAKNLAVVNANLLISETTLKRAKEDMENVYKEHTDCYNKCSKEITVSNVKFIKVMRLFSEGGNFGIQETKDFLKQVSKLDNSAEKALSGIKKEAETMKTKFITELNKSKDLTSITIKMVYDEYKHNDFTNQKIRNTERLIEREVCNMTNGLGKLHKLFQNLKVEAAKSCGDFDTFDNISNVYRAVLDEFVSTGEYLYHSTPIMLYSDKTEDKELIAETSPKSKLKIDAKEIPNHPSKLFNFKIGEENIYLNNLNRIIFESWNDIMATAKVFYVEHRQFLLDQSKIHQNLESFAEDISKKFELYLIQIELKWLMDVENFLSFSTGFQDTFLDYFDMYLQMYCSKSIKGFGTCFKQLKIKLNSQKRELIEMFRNLQNKLKPLHGHPNNAALLENLKREAEQVATETDQMVLTSIDPCLESLQNYFDNITDNFHKLGDVLPEIITTTNRLTIVNTTVSDHFAQKISLLKHFVEEQGTLSDLSALENNIPFVQSRNFLSRISKQQESKLPQYTSTLFSCRWSTASEGYVDVNDENEFLIELESQLATYRDVLQNRGFQKIQEELKMEWEHAVKCVLDLYQVKYDTPLKQ